MPKSYCLICGTPYEYVGIKPNFSPACGHSQTAFAAQPPPQYAPAPRYAPARPIYQEPKYFEEPYVDPDSIGVSVRGAAPEPIVLGAVIGSGPSNLGDGRRRAPNKTEVKKIFKQMTTEKPEPIEVRGD